MGDPLDICTIITKIKVDWSFVKGDVEYLEIDNHWIYLRFANPNDWFLVWSERLYHIQGELFVIYPWESDFDPYLEEIKWMDLSRIPRFPTELLKFESIDNLLASNNVCALCWILLPCLKIKLGLLELSFVWIFMNHCLSMLKLKGLVEKFVVIIYGVKTFHLVVLFAALKRMSLINFPC